VPADDPIEGVDHDEFWVSDYDKPSSEIRDALRPWIVEIAHIGNTAVPGLAAKPAIDMRKSHTYPPALFVGPGKMHSWPVRSR
jgi:GrpB-like predicted nucleotidyltransferase (UPF0157 family)